MLNLSFYCFIQAPGAAEASIRDLPPSAVSDPSNFDAMALLAAKKGSPLEAIVDQARDGSTIRVYLLPDFQYVQVFVAGIQVDTFLIDELFLLSFFLHSINSEVVYVFPTRLHLLVEGLRRNLPLLLRLCLLNKMEIQQLKVVLL